MSQNLGDRNYTVTVKELDGTETHWPHTSTALPVKVGDVLMLNGPATVTEIIKEAGGFGEKLGELYAERLPANVTISP